MKTMLRNRKAGVYVLMVAVLLQLVSLINYLAWAGTMQSVDPIITAGLAVGLAAGIGACLLSSDLLLVLSTAACSCGVLQLAVTNAGSFADWYQGIVMFGDPSQVPRILTICATGLLAVILLIVCGFMGVGRKEEAKA